jgi:excisionase family DNA binding protein
MPTEPTAPRWLTTKEAAWHLSVHPSRVRELAREGQLPHGRLGPRGPYRFLVADLDAYLHRQRQLAADA